MAGLIAWAADVVGGGTQPNDEDDANSIPIVFTPDQLNYVKELDGKTASLRRTIQDLRLRIPPPDISQRLPHLHAHSLASNADLALQLNAHSATRQQVLLNFHLGLWFPIFNFYVRFYVVSVPFKLGFLIFVFSGLCCCASEQYMRCLYSLNSGSFPLWVLLLWLHFVFQECIFYVYNFKLVGLLHWCLNFNSISWVNFGTFTYLLAIHLFPLFGFEPFLPSIH